MTLLDTASLILTPNAYKAGKLYSIVPSNGNGDMDVVRATTATRVNSLGLIETVSINVPRIDYSNASCPTLLVEPQRTNLFRFSDQFDDPNWAKASGTVTPNVAISPDGTQNADILNNADIYQQVAQSDSLPYSFSVYVKQNTASNITIGYIDNVTGFAGGRITYTYSTGVISITQSANASVSGQAIDAGNGWIRLVLKYTTIAAVTFNYQNISSNGSYIWGAQLELATFPTSYIPTLASSVTRNADVISKTGISSLIGQTEGTIFVQVKNKILGQTNRFIFFVTDPTAANYITLNYSVAQDNTIRFFVVANGVSVALTFKVRTGPIFKFAITYNNGLYKIFLNTELLYTQSGGAFTSNLENIYLGSKETSIEQLGEGLDSFIVYKTELTDQECINLTTL